MYRHARILERRYTDAVYLRRMGNVRHDGYCATAGAADVATASARSALRAAGTTHAPCAAAISAIVSPIPPEAPVMTTTCSLIGIKCEFIAAPGFLRANRIDHRADATTDPRSQWFRRLAAFKPFVS